MKTPARMIGIGFKNSVAAESDFGISNLNPATHINQQESAAQADGWLMGQIVRSAKDMATIHVCYAELSDRHKPFFINDFDQAFHESISREV